MLVHRLLDAFFRTLDAVDAVRDRVDRALGREPRPDPWAVEWPPPAANGDAHGEAHAGGAPHKNGEAAKGGDVAVLERPASRKAANAKPAPKKAKASNGVSKAAESNAAESKIAESKTAESKIAEAPPADGAGKPARKARKATKAGAAAKPKPTSRKATSKGRKGSVDRQGKDFDSPRARAVHEHVKDKRLGVVSEDAEHQGKKVLARVLWALWAAEQAGSEKGLTTADASALLHLSAGMEVFATNIGRACRDHGDLILETEPDGRSKRYKLTDAGRAAAESVQTAPLG